MDLRPLLYRFRHRVWLHWIIYQSSMDITYNIFDNLLNCVCIIVMHSTQATRNLWWSKLMDESQEEIRKEPPTTNVQVFYQDLNTGIEYVSTFTIHIPIYSRQVWRIYTGVFEDQIISRSYIYTAHFFNVSFYALC